MNVIIYLIFYEGEKWEFMKLIIVVLILGLGLRSSENRGEG